MLLKCKTCGKEFQGVSGRRHCSKECIRKSQYDNPKVKNKWSRANKRRFSEDPELKTRITEKAHEIVRARGLEKFRTNPTTKISKRGYRMVYVPQRGWVKEHHWIWEQQNGSVPKGKILHHINQDKIDNRLENLTLMDSKEHAKLHYAQRIIDKYGRFA